MKKETKYVILLRSSSINRFADGIDGVTGEEDDLTKLVHNLDTAAAKFGMEISGEKQDNDK